MIHRFIFTVAGAIYGGPGLLFLYEGQWFGAIWGIGVGLYCLWMIKYYDEQRMNKEDG